MTFVRYDLAKRFPSLLLDVKTVSIIRYKGPMERNRK